MADKSGNNFIIQCLRGASQVFFMENAFTGILFFVAMAYASYLTGVYATVIGAAIGVVVATLTARLLPCDEPSIQQGLYGFNGILIGIGLPTMIAASPGLWVLVVSGAAVSTVVTAAMAATLTRSWGIPGSTGPFVLTGWLMMAAAYNFGSLHVNDVPRLVTTFPHAGIVIPPAIDLVKIFFRNIGQVFLLESAVSGVIILVGVFVASVPAGIASAAGSLVAMVVAIGMRADPIAVNQGLWGFSSVLTALAMGVIFLRPSRRVALYALLATVMTVFVQGAIDVIVQPFGLSSFTAPYVLVMFLFVAPKKLFSPHPHEPVVNNLVAGETVKPYAAAS